MSGFPPPVVDGLSVNGSPVQTGVVDLAAVTSLAVNGGAPQTGTVALSTVPTVAALALPANPPVSGTVYQLAQAALVTVVTTINPAATAAGTVSVAVGTVNPPPAPAAPQVSVPGGLATGFVIPVTFAVPAGGYFSVTVVNGTLGTALAASIT